MTCGIYKITCRATNKVYIGQSFDIEHRWVEHRSDLKRGAHHSFHLQRAWDKYGKDVFEFEVLETCAAKVAHLEERERYWMQNHRSLDRRYGFNIAEGMNTYQGLPAERKAQLIEKLRRALSGERNPNFGKRMSDDQRRRLSLACIGRPSPNRGKPVPQEMRERISAALSGTNNPLFGKTRPEHSALMSGGGNPRARKVTCLTTGETFDCARDAGTAHGLTNSMILKCCKGSHAYAGRLQDGTKLRWAYA